MTHGSTPYPSGLTRRSVAPLDQHCIRGHRQRCRLNAYEPVGSLYPGPGRPRRFQLLHGLATGLPRDAERLTRNPTITATLTHGVIVAGTTVSGLSDGILIGCGKRLRSSQFPWSASSSGCSGVAATLGYPDA